MEGAMSEDGTPSFTQPAAQQQQQTVTSTSTGTVHKRPAEEEPTLQQNVGPSDALSRGSQAQPSGSEPTAAATAAAAAAGDQQQQQQQQPRPRPIFKMKRTGHSLPMGLSMSGRPTVLSPVSAAMMVLAPSPNPGPSRDRDVDKPSSDHTTIPRSADHDSVQKAGQAAKETENQIDPGSDAEVEPIMSPATHARMVDLIRSAKAKRPTSKAQGATASPSPSEPSIYSMSFQSQSRYTSAGTYQKHRAKMPRHVQEIFGNALDDQPYRFHVDDAGVRHSTAGALLPEGYQKSDDFGFPWVCAVRSCRKLLPSVVSLGRHFNNTHRAARLNDNMDGTFTDLGTYADPTVGDGRAMGGYPKPPLIVSKKPMSDAEAPTVAASIPLAAARSTITQRGGPQRNGLRRRSTLDTPDLDESDSSSPAEELAPERPPQKKAKIEQPIEMATGSRPYNMWRNAAGNLVSTFGALLPNGYEEDKTMPSRPWICPVRPCRRLFMSFLDLGNHFRGHHRASRLCDNMDGTFTVLSKGSILGPAIVVTQSYTELDQDPIGKPMRPFYPHGAGSKNAIWVEAEQEVPPDAPGQTEPDPNVDLPDADFPAITSDIPLTLASDGRPYREWWGESGDLIGMAGALIPAGYELDNAIPGRPWVCPVRTCRIACKSRRSMGYHFGTAHKSHNLNDNGDGTLSVVGHHDEPREPRVVSRNPLDDNSPPLALPRIPQSTNEAIWRVAAAESRAASSPSSSTATPQPLTTQPDSTLPASTAAFWEHISSRIPFPITRPTSREALALLHQPRLRNLTINHIALPPQHLGEKHIAGLIIHLVGQPNRNPCSECRRHAGDNPLRDGCVSLSDEMVQRVYPWLGTSSRACGNCLLRKQSSKCSVRRLYSLGRGEAALQQMAGKGLGGDEIAGLVEDGELLGEDLYGRRRSVRLSAVHADEEDEDGDGDVDMDAGDEREEDEVREARSTRVVTLRMPSRPALNGRQGKESRAGAGEWKRIPPRETDLRMEDWEMDDGRIEAAGDAMAFSSTYLTANQAVQISPSVSFLAVTIASGGVHKFAVDGKRTRICTLVTGKLRVQVGSSEPEFAIGAQGIFKVAPGVTCAVTNRCYVDVVLHVTTLPA